MFALFTAQNITHLNQWDIAEDFNISDLIQFIIAGKGWFLKLFTDPGSTRSQGPEAIKIQPFPTEWTELI